jgi:hypothetical protein
MKNTALRTAQTVFLDLAKVKITNYRVVSYFESLLCVPLRTSAVNVRGEPVYRRGTQRYAETRKKSKTLPITASFLKHPTMNSI